MRPAAITFAVVLGLLVVHLLAACGGGDPVPDQAAEFEKDRYQRPEKGTP